MNGVLLTERSADDGEGAAGVDADKSTLHRICTVPTLLPAHNALRAEALR
jgi:hypothetical protein